MKTQHSEVFYYAIAVYVLGAAAILTLPDSPEPHASTAQNDNRAGAEVANEMTKTSVRNAISAQSSGFVFAGTPEKF